MSIINVPLNDYLKRHYIEKGVPHTHTRIGDKEQSIFMKRPYVETVSITSIKKENKSLEMIYEDIVYAKKLHLKLNL